MPIPSYAYTLLLLMGPAQPALSRADSANRGDDRGSESPPLCCF